MPAASLRPLLIYGPTGSGKSDYALKIAERDGGVIINADSMQVYRELTTLTARPTALDEARAPHRLYGHVDAALAYSSGQWLRDCQRELAAALSGNLRPIIVGGTGLYFKALTEGFADVPDIDPQIRRHWRAIADTTPAMELWQMLAARDAEMAQRLRPSDAQRITRALEVIESTGQSLAHWQAQPQPPALAFDAVEAVVVDRNDTDLRKRLALRLDAIFAEPSLDEVAQLLARRLDAALPLMRAVGLAEARAFLSGETGRAAAIEAAAGMTWQYVRRQRTWARRHMKSWNCVVL